jgi:hypothetical protein
MLNRGMRTRTLFLLIQMASSAQSALRHPSGSEVCVCAIFLQACSETCASQATVHGLVQDVEYTVVLEVQGTTHIYKEEWIFVQSHIAFNYTIPPRSRGLHTVRISILDAHPETPENERWLSTVVRTFHACDGQCAVACPPASQDAIDAASLGGQMIVGDGDGFGQGGVGRESVSEVVVGGHRPGRENVMHNSGRSQTWCLGDSDLAFLESLPHSEQLPLAELVGLAHRGSSSQGSAAAGLSPARSRSRLFSLFFLLPFLFLHSHLFLLFAKRRKNVKSDVRSRSDVRRQTK